MFNLLNSSIFLGLQTMGVKFTSLLIVLMIIVIVHEFGHYLLARLIGADVEVFSFGIGKKLFSFTDRNKTVWQFAAFPLGGYVKIKGENGENLGEENQEMRKTNENNFEDKAAWKKCLVVLAGPFFNFLLSFIVIFSLFNFYGKPSLNLESEYEIIINNVSPNSLAEKNNLSSGDKILEINEQKIKNFDELQVALKKNSGQEIDLKIFSSKDQSEKNIKMILDNDGKLGIALETANFAKLEKLNFTNSIKDAFIYNFKLIKLTVLGVKKLFSSPEEIKNIGGLIQIADISGGAMKSGIVNFLFFLALLSINLGVINLLPLPALDGGRFIFYFLDLIWIGKFISPKIRGYSIGISFFLLIALMIFANLNDIHKIFFVK